MATSVELKSYTMSEVEQHNTGEDCWLIIGNESNGGPKVYDVSKYLDSHPGGRDIIEDSAGQDADEMFEDMGHSQDARTLMKRYLVGELELTEEEKAALLLKKATKKAGNNSGLMILVVLVAIGIGVYMQFME